MNSNQLKEQIKKLPTRPGIYLFKNSKNKPLYIGKALNLKNRLKSYLKTSDPRLGQMILETKKINFIKTESDIEALILESQYIKKYRPDFNIMLRDDKQYGFVGFTEEEYPKIFITHQPTKNENFIGPFTDIGALKITLRLLRRIFPYCTCKQTHHNYCLNYHIGKCIGDCCLKNTELRIMNYELQEYRKNIKAIKDILSGGKSSLIKKLEKEMKTISNKREYEKAIELQYKIEKLKRVFQNARIINSKNNEVMACHNNDGVLKLMQRELQLPSFPRRIEAYDIANIQGKYAVGAMIVFTEGKPDKNEYRKFKIYTKNTTDDTAMLREILQRRFNHPEWSNPDLILVDGGKAQLNAATASISKQIQSASRRTKFKIPIIALTKNEKHVGHKILTNKAREVSLSKLSTPLKNLLLQINSEAHRFAISYYRKLHRKNLKFRS